MLCLICGSEYNPRLRAAMITSNQQKLCQQLTIIAAAAIASSVAAGFVFPNLSADNVAVGMLWSGGSRQRTTYTILWMTTATAAVVRRS